MAIVSFSPDSARTRLSVGLARAAVARLAPMRARTERRWVILILTETEPSLLHFGYGWWRGAFRFAQSERGGVARRCPDDEQLRVGLPRNDVADVVSRAHDTHHTWRQPIA